MIRNVITGILVTSALFTASACSKDSGSDCAKVVDHTAKLIGMDFPAAEKKEAIARCEKEPAAVRECALKAKDVEQLMACKPS